MYSFGHDNGASKCPCRGCGGRDIGCHGKCEEYVAWLAEYRKAKEAEKVYAASQDTISTKARKEIWREMRYCRKQTFKRTDKSR